MDTSFEGLEGEAGVLIKQPLKAKPTFLCELTF
jgi:hypothetical protein